MKYLSQYIFFLHCKKNRKNYAILPATNTVKFTADRTFYITVFSTDKDRIFFTWVYHKHEMKIVSFTGLSGNFEKL